MKNFKDKKVLVVGMGKSGVAAVQALLQLEALVYVQDAKEASDMEPQLLAFLQGKIQGLYLGQDPDPSQTFDVLVLSPGVSPHMDFIERAKEQGAEIIGELEIAYRVGQGNYVAITGTNGKTTTTTLTGEIFRKSGRRTYVVGNIGVAVISKALSAEEDSWLITETSSFQLETIRDFHPRISAILNLTPDHMDRHETMENYGDAKARIFENQGEGDFLILNWDDPALRKYGEQAKCTLVPFSRKEVLSFGVFVQDGMITVAEGDGRKTALFPVSELQIPGDHNLENALAATGIAWFAGIGAEDIQEVLRNFQGVEHRMEFSGEVDGIRFINDSKGTNPDASIKAIQAVKGPILLIAGGYDKASSFEELIQAFDGRVKELILLGKTAEKIAETARRLGFDRITMVRDMDEGVKTAYQKGSPGDTVLLSPACASWDMYRNFEQRGEHFKECVARLLK